MYEPNKFEATAPPPDYSQPPQYAAAPYPTQLPYPPQQQQQQPQYAYYPNQIQQQVQQPQQYVVGTAYPNQIMVGQPNVAYVAQQPQQIVVLAAPAHHPPKPAGEVCQRRIKTPYGVFRLIQALLSVTLVGLIAGMLSYDPTWWYYWLWLLVVPLASLSSASSQLCSSRTHSWAHGGCGDISYAITYGLLTGSIALIYYVYYWALFPHWYWANFVSVADASLAISGILSFTYFMTGFSICCCKCMECNMPPAGEC